MALASEGQQLVVAALAAAIMLDSTVINSLSSDHAANAGSLTAALCAALPTADTQ